MFKKTVVTIVCTIVAFCMVIALSACGAEINSEHVLAELYKSGELGKSDIENIAALRVGYIAKVKNENQTVEDYKRVKFEPIVPAPLEDVIRQQIEEDVKARIDGEFLSFELANYYGKYGDYYIVEITYNLESVDYTPAVYPLIVSNVFLGYIGPPYELLAWKAN